MQNTDIRSDAWIGLSKLSEGRRSGHYLCRMLKMMYRNFAAFAALTSILGCTTSKQVQAPPQEDIITEYVLLDSLIVTPETHGETIPAEIPWTTATRKMDLLHTELELLPDWSTQTIKGRATLSLTPFAYPADTLTLNAQFFDIHEIMVDGVAQSVYAYDGSILRIPLSESYAPGRPVKCIIDYTAHPHKALTREKQGLFFIDPFDTIPDLPTQIWTSGETQYNSQWFPTIDQPNERHTQNIHITVDTSFTTISNGVLLSSETRPTGKRTDHWTMTQSHAPYLTVLVIGKFDVVPDEWNSLPLKYYVDKGYGPSATEIFAHTPEMLSFFSDLLDYPYPWAKYDQIIVNEFTSGAMENTTAVTFSTAVQSHHRDFLSKGENDGIVAHEMIHHWFGDLLTCESWSHLALNEGFANYGEYLWYEFKYGKDEAQRARIIELYGYLSAAENDIHPLVHFHFEEPDDMFDAHSYNKGALTLHHLRQVLGDTVFFQGIRKYLHDNAYQSVEIHDLRLAMEAVSGRDLNQFFDQWYFSAGHPDVSVSEYYNAESEQLEITIVQTQDPHTSRDVFQFPLAVQLFYENQTHEIKSFHVDSRAQTFIVQTPTPPVAVAYDPDGGLPWEYAFAERTVAQCRLLMRHENTWHTRNEASSYMLESLQEFTNDDIRYALKDPFWEFRQRLLFSINLMERPELAEEILLIAKQDPDVRVRLAAKFCLGGTGDPQYSQLFSHWLQSTDKVIEIRAALVFLSNSDPEAAALAAKAYEQDSSISVLLGVARAYAVVQNPDHGDFFHTSALKFGEYGKTFFEDYALWASGQKEPLITSEVAILRTMALAEENDLNTRFYATYGLWYLQSLLEPGSPLQERIMTTFTEIRTLNQNPTLNEWYQSFD